VSVWAVEAQRQAPVKGGEFRLDGLVPGPVTLEIRSGDRRLGRIDVPDLPAGAAVTLRGLRVDAATGRAFPADVELRGADRVTVNGIRMAPNDRIPGDVDARGTVLAISDDAGAFLLRPADSTAADLRVVVMPATRTATRDGAPARIDALSRGDSVRVKGSARAGYVIAAAVELPPSRATSASTGDDPTADENEPESNPSLADAPASHPSAPSDAPAPMLGRSAGPPPPPPIATQGRGHGRGRGHGKKGRWD
jgi:hypothetical protein